MGDRGGECAGCVFFLGVRPCGFFFPPELALESTAPGVNSPGAGGTAAKGAPFVFAPPTPAPKFEKEDVLLAAGGGGVN